MSLEQIFSLCSNIAMVGWLGLALAPRWHVTREWFAPVVAPLLIGIFYIWLMMNNFGSVPDGAGFNSLAAVSALFSMPELILAGWIHYLAFDLCVGAWEVKDAQQEGIHHFLVIPCLFATLLFGPGGLILYWLIKLVFRATQKTVVNEAQ
ncbi:MAG: ABA4-like family protein [Porticoccaceae bacterium]|nr:ABA4-like family protein [Porticoccaceae bacterium]MDG1475247.1 ABA4-like family protein [Porticoccaceae bacterium]